MSLIPDSPYDNEKETTETNPSLQAGLMALKQGDYQSAIAQLKEVCDFELDPATILRAQMGLVTAYRSIKEAQKASALCQHLIVSSNPQVKQWAEQTLAELGERSPTGTNMTQPSSQKAPTSDSTGFVPFDPTAQAPQPSSPSPTSPTGFVPLESNPAQESSKVKQPQDKKTQESINSVKASLTDNLSNKQANAINPPASKAREHKKAEEPKNSVPESLTDNLSVLQTKAVNPSAAKQRASSTNFTPNPHIWRQAGRAQRWQPLPPKLGFKPDWSQLWGVQVLTAIALFWLLRLILQLAASTTNDLLVKLPYLEPIQSFYSFYYQPTLPLLIGLAILLVLCPWLITGLLKLFYGLKPLSVETLKTHSPEAVRVLQRISRERRLPLPSLGLLPTDAPIALTFGNLPQTARIVISQGLLDQLADDEIATIYIAQLGHILHWDFVLMSLGILIAQIPYTVYWVVAQWGEQWEGPILRGTTGAIASVAYGIYWLLRWPLVWLSRIRIYFSDRFCTDATGNPNGLTRALLKIAIGIAKDIEQQGKTPWILEGFDLLMPLGYRQAITLGSLSPYAPFEPVLAWDILNPSRRWLALNNSHPLTGDRLQLLSRYARHWNLEPELNFTKQSPPGRQNSKLRLQGAPYFGIGIGLVLGLLLWLTGQIGELLRIRLLSWLLDDYGWFLLGFVLAGFSIGTLIRINPFFPDITASTRPDELTLPDLLDNPTTLPIDSQPIRLQGKLLGRPGISNWLGQDLILQSRAGLVKLHHLSWLGSIGNLLPQDTRPSNLVNQPITVSGWFRRGATPWIDIETLSTPGKTSQSGHPVWSTLLATVAAVCGAYIIVRGGF